MEKSIAFKFNQKAGYFNKLQLTFDRAAGKDKI